MNIADIDISTLLPHVDEIVLLDTLKTVSDDSLVALTRVREDGLFNNNQNQVPSFIAVEYMAQAIAAWAGYRGQSTGLPVRNGLLLGVREFNANVDYMPVATPLEISVVLVMEMQNGMAVFDGQTTGPGISISGRLSVLSVESLENLNADNIK